MNSCKYYHALGQVTYTLLTGRTLCHCSAPHRQDHHKDKTRLRQAQQLLLSLVQQSLLSLAQQTLLSLAQQSLPNWPNIYKFATCNVSSNHLIHSSATVREVNNGIYWRLIVQVVKIES